MTMKPDWKDAPEWARWLAQDRSGEWYWHQYEPQWEGAEWESVGLNRRAGYSDPAKTLERRP